MTLVRSMITEHLRVEIVNVAEQWVNLKRQEAFVVQEQANLTERWAGILEMADFLDPAGDDPYTRRAQQVKQAVQAAVAANDLVLAQSIIDEFKRSM